MAILGSFAVGRAPALGARRLEVDFVLEGGRRLVAAALLLVTGLLFMTPPVVAILVIAGVVR